MSGEKRKSGKGGKAGGRGAEKQTNQGSLSDKILRMSETILTGDRGDVSQAAVAAVLFLGCAAWNSANGDPLLAERHKEELDRIDWEGAKPFTGMKSSDTVQLITDLVVCKQKWFPDDSRLVHAFGLTPEGRFRVQSINPGPFSPARGSGADAP